MAKRGSHSKRKLSEYNLFIKAQLKKGMSFSEAAKEWRTLKKSISKKTKKETKKTSEQKESSQKTKEKTMHSNLEKALLENLVALQKINTDLAEKFDFLAKEISHLLALFEGAARSFVKSAPLGEFEKDKEFLSKIDKLLEQNKILAKGLTMMEERLKERVYGGPPKPPQRY